MDKQIQLARLMHDICIANGMSEKSDQEIAGLLGRAIGALPVHHPMMPLLSAAADRLSAPACPVCYQPLEVSDVGTDTFVMRCPRCDNSLSVEVQRRYKIDWLSDGRDGPR